MAKTFYLSLFGAVLVIATLTSCSQPIETRQMENSNLRIKVSTYRDPGFIIAPGGTYVFESSPVGHEDWRKVAAVHRDIVEPISEDTVRLLNEQIAFVYLDWMFAVTLDGGNEWTVWDSRDYIFSTAEIKWGKIKAISINGDGHGEMLMRVFPSSNGCLKLSTQDFGHTWTESGQIRQC